jgi:N-acetylglucosaminyldiphosphoundecaprenol N-acetyl-beta-D-mannosaminyltransferase
MAIRTFQADFPMTDPLIPLLDGSVHAVTEARTVELVMAGLRASRGGWVVTHNLDHLRLLRRDPDFLAACSHATLRVADGMPLIWASRLAGTPLPERVAGSNLISSLSAAAAREGRSVFLLGGNPGAAEGAAAVLQARHRELRCAGILCPPMGFEDDLQVMAEIREILTQARPDIVFVALSAPRQEKIIARLREAAPQAWWMGVGISFSFLSGQVHRAPVWMQRVGLEWLHRLCQEPRKLARRYLLQDIPFAAELFMGSLRRRWTRSRGRSPGVS